MKRLPCFALAIVLMTACTFAETSAEDKDSPENRATLEKKRDKISAEIGKLRDHPWAGRYYHGDGLGANVTLTLAPESGFTVTWFGCLGLYDLNYGDVVWDKDRFKLSFALPTEKGGIGSYAEEYVPDTCRSW